MNFKLTHVKIPPETPRVTLIIRVVDGAPVLFTEDGKYVEGQRGMEIAAHMDDVLSCKADFFLGRWEVGLPE